MAKTIAIIGCGGVAAHMLPALIHDYNLILVDGDKYEPKNCNRQLAAHVGNGKNKAETLAEIYKGMTKRTITPVTSYVNDDTDFEVTPDILMVLVDNDDARCSCKAIANRLFIPIIWAANETYDPQAMLYEPENEDHPTLDPFVRFGIKPDGKGPGRGCNTVEAVEENPQLPTANNIASAFALMILYSFEQVANPANRLAEVIGVTNAVTSRRVKDLEESTPPVQDIPTATKEEATKEKTLA